MKVLSYNILEGGTKRLSEIANVIQSQDPDVVALLEANSRSRAMRLARELQMKVVFGKANNKFHIAWLSRIPIRRSENHRLPILSKTLLEIEVVWKGVSFRLFATHLASGHDAVHPAEEVPAILEVLRPLAGEPHLLVGDLNALRPCDPVGTPPKGVEKMGDAVDADPRQAIRSILEAGYLDCYRACHPDVPGYTYPTDSPWLRLDYVFASPEMASCLRACDLVARDTAVRASDHFPVWAEFRRR